MPEFKFKLIHKTHSGRNYGVSSKGERQSEEIAAREAYIEFTYGDRCPGAPGARFIGHGEGSYSEAEVIAAAGGAFTATRNADGSFTAPSALLAEIAARVVRECEESNCKKYA